MKGKRIKKLIYILVVCTVTFLIFQYKENVMIIILKYLKIARNSIDKTLFTTIIVCICSLLSILTCLIIAKIIDRVNMKKYSTGVPFSKRHPKLNMIIALFLVLILGDIAWVSVYYVFQYLVLIITNLIDWISNMASKLDAVVIVALITGMVSIIGVIISSIVAKIIDYRKSRQDYLAKKREEPYGEFVEMIYKIQQNTKKKGSYTEDMMREDLSKFSKKITLWGSSKVVNKWVRFRENGANPEAWTDNLFLLEEIMNEMRKDLGLKKIKKGNLLAFFVNDIKKIMKGIKR